jgi:organic radical activating enzyme
MAEGNVGQIFNSVQGEGLYVGRRQVFVRFAGCSLDCLYCDTKEFRKFRPGECEVETKPGSMKFKYVQNPMTYEEVLRHVKRLITSDTHSISLTGGEPLLAGNFLVNVARSCKGAGFLTYLETNGASSEAMEKVAEYIDIAAIDIKLPEHEAVPRRKWLRLLEEELACIKITLKSEVETFVKIVVLPSTRTNTIMQVCKQLVRIGKIPVVLQPVTPAGRVRSAPSMTHVYQLAQAAARAGVKEIAIIPQVHKLIGVL